MGLWVSVRTSGCSGLQEKSGPRVLVQELHDFVQALVAEKVIQSVL